MWARESKKFCNSQKLCSPPPERRPLMSTRFDEISKLIASPLPRRQVFTLALAMLAAGGLNRLRCADCDPRAQQPSALPGGINGRKGAAKRRDRCAEGEDDVGDTDAGQEWCCPHDSACGTINTVPQCCYEGHCCGGKNCCRGACAGAKCCPAGFDT